jgi:hypothetical protein
MPMPIIEHDMATRVAIKKFLSRFAARGWLNGASEDAFEQTAIEYGLNRGWLRRERSDVHFTSKGHKVLAA